MSMRDRLVELMNQAVMNMPREEYEKEIGMEKVIKCIADYLIQNGVIVLPCKPIPLIKDKNLFNCDVYCPTCGTNLSGYYGDEPLSVIQCFNCGELLDNTKSITREEAEKALERDKNND